LLPQENTDKGHAKKKSRTSTNSKILLRTNLFPMWKWFCHCFP